MLCAQVVVPEPLNLLARPDEGLLAIGERAMRRSSGMRMSNASPASLRTSSKEIPTEASAPESMASDSPLASSRFTPSEESASAAIPSSARRMPSRRSSSPNESWPSILASSNAASTLLRVLSVKRVNITRPSSPAVAQGISP